MENKYQEIINNNPKDSLDRSIKTKQAWQKYGGNFKKGSLTNNTEDKFDFKDKTKRNYSLSSRNVYTDLSILPAGVHDSVFHVVNGKNCYLGSVDLEPRPDDNGNWLCIEYMKKTKGMPSGFAPALLDFLYNFFGSIFDGVILHPISERLREYYKGLGFSYYINTDEETDYWRIIW